MTAWFDRRVITSFLCEKYFDQGIKMPFMGDSPCLEIGLKFWQ